MCACEVVRGGREVVRGLSSGWGKSLPREDNIFNSQVLG